MFGDTSGDNEYFMNSLWHRTIDGKELDEYDDDYQDISNAIYDIKTTFMRTGVE